MRSLKSKRIIKLFAVILSCVLLIQSSTVYAVSTITDTDMHSLYVGPAEHSAVLSTFTNSDTVTWLEKINAGWVRIRLSDGTVGYCDAALLGKRFTEDETAAVLYKTNDACRVFSSADRSAPAVCILPKNSRLPFVSSAENGFSLVRLENGRLGYLPTEVIEPVRETPAVVRTVPKLIADTGVTTEEQAAARLTELSSYFQNGRYWNSSGTESEENLFSVTDSPCAHPTDYYAHCNVYTSKISAALGYDIGMQCTGYAGLLSDLVFGTEAPFTEHGDFEKLRVGDHIRLVLWDHSMIVTKVCKDENEKTYVYVTEVNADYDTCRIDWGRKFTQQDLRRLGDYVEIHTRYPVEENTETES